jgi:hypothetical protein
VWSYVPPGEGREFVSRCQAAPKAASSSRKTSGGASNETFGVRSERSILLSSNEVYPTSSGTGIAIDIRMVKTQGKQKKRWDDVQRRNSEHW